MPDTQTLETREVETLVLRFDAPFQAWSVGAKGTVRPTQKEPSLSGVVGLIANALGLSRHDDLADLADLDMGSRTDRSGVLTRDWYTAGTTTGVAMREEYVGPSGQRAFRDTVSTEGVVGVKQYLSGAVFTVAVTGPADVLHQAAAALDAPVRPLYLGRRSCPVSRPPVDGFSDTDVEATLRSWPLDAALVPGEGQRVRAWHADEDMRLVLPALPGDPDGRVRWDRPPATTGASRAFRPRSVRIDQVSRASLTGQTELAGQAEHEVGVR